MKSARGPEVSRYIDTRARNLARKVSLQRKLRYLRYTYLLMTQLILVTNLTIVTLFLTILTSVRRFNKILHALRAIRKRKLANISEFMRNHNFCNVLLNFQTVPYVRAILSSDPRSRRTPISHESAFIQYTYVHGMHCVLLA